MLQQFTMRILILEYIYGVWNVKRVKGYNENERERGN